MQFSNIVSNKDISLVKDRNASDLHNTRDNDYVNEGSSENEKTSNERRLLKPGSNLKRETDGA